MRYSITLCVEADKNGDEDRGIGEKMKAKVRKKNYTLLAQEDSWSDLAGTLKKLDREHANTPTSINVKALLDLASAIRDAEDK